MNSKSENVVPENLVDDVAQDIAEAKRATELEQLQSKVQDAEERALRFQAEIENVRKRLRREMDDERKYAQLPFMRDLLPVIDNFHRALSSLPPGADPNLLDGIKMVARQVMETFEKYHCATIDAVNVPFDPAIHEAVGQAPSSSVPAGSVTDVRQAGYRLHDRVIRPAYVVVSSGPE